MARLAFAERLSCLVTPNPRTLLRISEIADLHQAEIIRAIRDGALKRAILQKILYAQGTLPRFATRND